MSKLYLFGLPKTFLLMMIVQYAEWNADSFLVPWLQEMDAPCRQSIFDNHQWMQQWTDRKSTVPHVFGNILDQVPENCFSERKPFYKRRDEIQRAWLQRAQFCYSHNQLCECAVPVDFDFSGLPSQDNSTANTQRQYFEGNNGSVYLVWAKKHRFLRTPLLVVENTPEPWIKIKNVLLWASGGLRCDVMVYLLTYLLYLPFTTCV